MSTSTAATPVKRACDSCHRRKVKCIGEGTNPCKNCLSAGLACTYNAIPQKKGPKGSRAKVLSELRENQRQSQLAAGFPSDLGFDVPTQHPTPVARTSGLLPPNLIESCLDFYFNNVYPSYPVLHRQRAQEIVLSIELSAEAYCMVAALCAYVMIQSNMSISPNLLPRAEMAQMSNVSIGHMLLEDSARVRKGVDYLESPTHLSVLTSWLYYGCYFGLGRDNTAWSFLREATTLAFLVGLHDEEAYKNDPLDLSRRRVLYWLLFVADRSYALHKHRPISLPATIHSRTLDEEPTDRPIALGLDLLVNLYKPFDESFIGVWNKVRSNANPRWIAQLQSQLSDALPTYLDCAESQAVDLRVSQQWLRTVVWRLCVSQGMVSSVAADTAMTFKYPIEISRDVLSLTHQFSQQAMEVQSIELIEKLFDIACCLTDVVASIPFSPDAFALGPRDYVSRFLVLFSALHGGQTRYLPLLVAKVSNALPSLPIPRSLNVPQNMSPSAIGHSPGGLVTVPSNANEDMSHLASASSLTYPSNELMRQHAAQTGVRVPFDTSQQSLLQPPSSRVEELSLYDAPAPHTAARSTSSATASQSATPGPYEPSPSQPRSQVPIQPRGHLSNPQQRTHMQAHHLGVNPEAYDPRFHVQGFPVDPSMVFKQEEGRGAGQVQGQTGDIYGSAHGAGHGNIGHPGRGHGGYGS